MALDGELESMVMESVVKMDGGMINLRKKVLRD